MPDLPQGVRDLVREALKEDVADNDVTSAALIPPGVAGTGEFLFKADGVLAGLSVVQEVFAQVDPSVDFFPSLLDGSFVPKGHSAGHVRGDLKSILSGERVALNFLQHLSGVATETKRYVDAVAGTQVKILDTRKTLPGLRQLQKYAVRMGGGRNHRMDLGDGILVKDNHIAALRGQGWALARIVRKALDGASGSMKVEIEVSTLEEAREAVEAGAYLLLLDNMDLGAMREAAAMAQRRGCRTEASGGITLERIRAIAETGVNFISIGALTHSVRTLDISLEVIGA